MLRKIKDIDEALNRISATSEEAPPGLLEARLTVISNACHRIRKALADPLLRRKVQDE